MPEEDLLVHKADTHSQNGEDGIIAAIFSRLGVTTEACCEFGAWDGIYLSNCRSLILQGWSAVMIEADESRFQELVGNYSSHSAVTCINRYVGTSMNSLGTILREHGHDDLDLLCIDIDGLDYEVFETLDIRPRVICIEVNAGHDPDAETRIDRDVAQHNVGQPLQVFADIANEQGYDLVCYTGNAFFVHREQAGDRALPVLTSRQAYEYFLNHLTMREKEWLYLVNLGIVNPYFAFCNPYLTRRSLGIPPLRAMWTQSTRRILEGAQRFRRGLTRKHTRVHH